MTASELAEVRAELFAYPQDSTCLYCLSTWNNGPYHHDDCLLVRFEAAAKAEAVAPLWRLIDKVQAAAHDCETHPWSAVDAPTWTSCQRTCRYGICAEIAEARAGGG